MAATGGLEKKKESVDKNNKYDRQLRLWGDHGQSALESSTVCLINATASGTEILKNLILPGIGSYTIVDGHKVTGEDVGNNFFLTKDSIGKSRAQVATELLGELNADVSGDFLEENVENLLEESPSFFSNFTIIVATNLTERVLTRLVDHLWRSDVPLLVCRCYGFIGYMRLVVREHTVIESHPDTAHEDLRLDQPFPGLINFCDTLDLTKMNKKDHSHTPWLVLIYKYLQEWKTQHNGDAPKSYKEKKELKELIRQGILITKDGVPDEEDNFEEAIRNLNTSLVPTTISSEIQKLFHDVSCIDLNSESKSFWILLRAVKDFVSNEGNGSLPLRGTIPDMTSDSERYIQLQIVYREQAAKDLNSITKRVYDLLQQIGKDEPVNPVLPSLDSVRRACAGICEKDIKTFCRNASFLRVIRCRSLADEYNSQTMKSQEIGMQLEDEDNDSIVFYVLLRAVDRFYEAYNRYPGLDNDHVETDIPKLKSCVCKLMQEWGLPQSIKDDYVHEMCRYGAAELHPVAAFMGGCAAQEVIKIITGQFIPINNTFIYNAMKQTSTTLEL